MRRRVIRELLGVELARTDELQCLIDGVNMVLQEPQPQLYRINHRDYKYVGLFVTACRHLSPLVTMFLILSG